MTTIYFDHGATTPMAPEVITTMQEAMTTTYGNPSSVHSLGRKAKAQLNEARSIIAKTINAQDSEIIFTSGGTESDNFAIRQTVSSRQHLGKHIITSAVEHPAVLETMKELGKSGFELTILPVNEQGFLTVDQVKKALRDDTILVSLMWTNNETGVNFPIKEIGEMLNDHQTFFHTDAVQAFGLADIDVSKIKVDLLSASAHKINGPKGVGFLFKRNDIQLPAFQTGGKQENIARPGTENLIGILGFSKAVELIEKNRDNQNANYQILQEQLITELTEKDISFEINGCLENKSNHILNLWLKDIPNQQMLMQLDLAGIAISIGSACTAGAVEASHVLTAMFGEEDAKINESIRVSFGLGNTSAEITKLVEEIVNISNRVKS